MRELLFVHKLHTILYEHVLLIDVKIITPRAFARGKAIGLSVCHRYRHENHQISGSRHLCVLQAQPISKAPIP